MTCSGLLCIYRASQLERLLSSVDTFKLKASEMKRIELTETIERLNKTQPKKAAVDVCEQIAQMDPRAEDLRCFFCCETPHAKDCIWVRATVIAKQAPKEREKAS